MVWNLKKYLNDWKKLAIPQFGYLLNDTLIKNIIFGTIKNYPN